MDAASAESVAPGDAVRIGGWTVARIENVRTFATEDPNQRRLFAAVTLDTHRQQNRLRFGGHAIRRGQSLTVADSRGLLRGLCVSLLSF